jgi:alanyl-tRNA synthetase
MILPEHKIILLRDNNVFAYPVHLRQEFTDRERKVTMSLETMLTGTQIRTRFLEFFVNEGHLEIPSSSLVPRNDPTVLLTTAGMQQILPYFLGRETPPALRMTSVQKCFRTTDIDNVGNERSLTFFEMLGNFSVGDYFKREAISFAWDLLTRVFLLPPERLIVTVHPEDEEATRLWSEIAGFPDAAITRLEDNWWGPERDLLRLPSTFVQCCSGPEQALSHALPAAWFARDI